MPIIAYWLSKDAFMSYFGVEIKVVSVLMYRLHQPWGIFKIWDGNAWSRDALSREHKLLACIFVVIQSNGG